MFMMIPSPFLPTPVISNGGIWLDLIVLFLSVSLPLSLSLCLSPSLCQAMLHLLRAENLQTLKTYRDLQIIPVAICQILYKAFEEESEWPLEFVHVRVLNSNRV
jgi:hypothetical protein